MTLTIASLEDLFRFLFVLTRLGAMLLPLPFLGSRIVPVQLKVVFVLVLSVSVYPAVQTQPVPVPLGPVHLAGLLLGELFTGLLIGYAAQALFAGIQLGGEVMNQQMGLGLVHLFDPQNTQQISLVTHFQYVIATLVFFSGSVHHGFIHAMAESLHVIPLVEFAAPKTVVLTLVTLLGKACIVALKIAAPLLMTLLLTNLALGIVARLVPQMNVFLVSLPVSFGVGLVVLGISMAYVVGGLRLGFAQLGSDLLLVMRLLGGK